MARHGRRTPLHPLTQPFPIVLQPVPPPVVAPQTTGPFIARHSTLRGGNDLRGAATAVNAPAGNATGTGSAFDATVAIGGQAEGAIASGSTFTDDFTELAPIGHVDGDNFGRWNVQFDEASTANVIPVDVSGTRYLRVQSDNAGGGPSTYSSLVTTQAAFTAWSNLSVEYITDTQFRTPTPNRWEVGWVFFNYTNNNSFYYVLLCPDGYWELGKEWYNGVSQQQDFLAYGTAPVTWPLGDRLRVEVDQVVNGSSVTLTFRAKDVTRGDVSYQTLVSNFTDDGSRASGAAYLSGSVGLYVEDSSARFGSVELDSPHILDASPAVTAAPATATGAGTAPDPTVAATVAADTTTAAGTAYDATVNAGVTWAWNAEGGTDQATIATSDTGSGQPWDTVVVGTGATVKYEAASPLNGALSMYVDVGATSASAYTQWVLSAARTTGYTGFAFRYSSTFGGSCSIWSANSGSTARVRLQITSADKLRVLNAAGTAVWTSTTTLTPGTYYYTSVAFTSDVSGSATVKLYDQFGTLLEDSGAVAADFAGTFDRLRYGSVANQTSTTWRPLRYDEITFSTVGAPQAPIGAPAGVGSGTGTAYDTAVGVTASAEAPTGAGAALDAAASSAAGAGVASGTGAAFDSLSALGVNGDIAAGSGSASDAAVDVSAAAGTATGSGAAPDGVASVGAAAGAGSGTGTAFDAQTTVAVNADAALATGTANDATVSTSSSTSAPAENAAGTATALDAGVALTVPSGSADGVGAALDAVAAAGASPAEAAGTGTALSPTVDTAANSGNAAGAGTALDAIVGAGPNAEATTGGGQAYDTGTAVAANAGVATGAGSAWDAGTSIGAAAEVPTGAGIASDPSAAVTVNAEAAAATGTAYDPTVSTINNVNANAEAATGAGAAYDATVSIGPAAACATGAGTAYDSVAGIGVAAENTTGAGTAGQAAPDVAAAPVTATGVGAAGDPFAAIAAMLEVAAAVGAAYGVDADIPSRTVNGTSVAALTANRTSTAVLVAAGTSTATVSGG